MKRYSITSVSRIIACIGAVCLTGCAAAVDQVFPTPAPTRIERASAIPIATSAAIPTPIEVLIQPFGTSDPNATLLPTINAAALSVSSTPLISVFATSFLATATRPSAALGVARIEYFSADVQEASPGDVITLFWAATGAEAATIFRVDEAGEPIRQWNVGNRGSLQVRTREDDTGLLQLQLVIGTGDNRAEEQISVTFRCAAGWFIVPPPPGCPNAPIYGSVFAFQRFERGRMIWIEQQKRVYILYEDGNQPGWEVYPDEFKDGMPDSDPAFAPPEGLIQPVRGFGLVWRSTQTVRDRLGFATEGETSFTSDFQGDPVVAEGQMGLRLVDGTVIVLDGTNRTWRVSAGLAPGATVSTPESESSEVGITETATLSP